MRAYRTMLHLGALALPLLAWAVPGQALAQNNFLDQAQKLLNGNNNQDQQNAYERGRADEQRRIQAERDRRRDYDRDRTTNRNDWRDRPDSYRPTYRDSDRDYR
jgi:hypothetical protein